MKKRVSKWDKSLTNAIDRRSGETRAGGLKQRILLLLAITSYVGCFQWMYIHYLYPMQEYFGYSYNAPGTSYVVLAWLLSILPALWMPMELRRPSQLAYWILYITVLIPSMFVPLFAALDPPREISGLMLVLFGGFLIAGVSYLLPLMQVRALRLPSRTFWLGFGILGGSLFLWMMVVYHNHLQFVSFTNVFEQRQVAGDIAEGSRSNYSYMWLSGVVDPFLMGWGLYYKRRWMFALGALGQLLVYGVVASKTSIVSIPLIATFYWLFRVGHQAFALKLISASVALIGSLCIWYYSSGENPGLLQAIVLAVVAQRTLSAGGLATAQYYDFFQRNPLTHLSHVTGVNWFVRYPYKNPIGEEIGLAYSGTTDLDATAHFWATDGLEAFGLTGILFVSVLCAFVFWMLDSTAREYDPRFIALLFSFAVLNLANASIFTSLLSGGLILLILLVYLMPDQAERMAIPRPAFVPGHGGVR